MIAIAMIRAVTNRDAEMIVVVTTDAAMIVHSNHPRRVIHHKILTHQSRKIKRAGDHSRVATNLSKLSGGYNVFLFLICII
jgi:hypothetical protein